LRRSISIRDANTTDGYEVLADKHYTYDIERGTLHDAIQNGYIDSYEAEKARAMKAQRIAREILVKKRELNYVQEETPKNEHDTSNN
jgi:hypothetical protein